MKSVNFACFYIFESLKEESKKMTISNLNLNSNFGRRNNLSRSSVAGSMNLNRSRSASILPNRLYNSKFVGARSTNIKPDASYSQRLSRNLNNGNVPRQQSSQIQYQSAIPTTAAVGLSGLAGNFGAMSTTTVNNSGANFMEVGKQVGNIAFDTLNKLGVIDNIKENGINGIFGGKTNSQVLTSAVESITGGKQGAGVSADIQGIISSMSSATTSADLSTAIGKANSTLTTMNSQTGSLQEAANKAENALPTIEKEVGSAKNAESGAKEVVTTQKGQVEGAKLGVTNAKNALDQAYTGESKAANAFKEASKNLADAKSAKTEANGKYEQAQNNTNLARSNFDQASATAASTPQYRTETDAEGNSKQVPNEPAYTNAQNAKNDAQRKLTAAINAENTAKEALAKATEKETEATNAHTKAKGKLEDAKDLTEKEKTDLKKADENLQKSEDTLNTKQELLSDATEAYDIAKNTLEQATQAYNAATSVINQFKQHKQNVSDLSKAITEQNKRLEQMKQQEEAEKAKATENDKKSQGAKETPAKSQTDYSKMDDGELTNLYSDLKNSGDNNTAREVKAELDKRGVNLLDEVTVTGKQKDYSKMSQDELRDYVSSNLNILTNPERLTELKDQLEQKGLLAEAENVEIRIKELDNNNPTT